MLFELRIASRRATAVLIALAAFAAMVAPASADTRTDVSGAQRRLSALERTISTDRAHIASMHASLKSLAAAVTYSRRQADEIQARVVHTRTSRSKAEARYRTIRAQIGEAARRAYIEGPTYWLSTVFDVTSLSDATAIEAYADDIVSRDAALARRVRRVAAELRAREKQESALMIRRDTALARLSREQNALTDRFAQQQVRLASLAQARAEVASLVVRLRKQLRAEEIAAAMAAISRGTPVSFGKWASAFLATTDLPVARNNLVVVVAWEAAEWTDARWNPLATTYPMRGATTYNDSGVRNYVSFAQGLDATLRTLKLSGFGYENILASLARNADPMGTARAINASGWCSGCADGNYVVALIPSVQKYYDRYASAGS
ncbi:MAG: hypothetical protein LC750_17015 [Actinobacteria bacterium]|nr:hypothetical protein [Actinomycetota bacterium]